MDFVPIHLRRFLGESTIPSPEEVARYRRANLRRNGQVRSEMDAAWQDKKEMEQDPIRQRVAAIKKRNEMDRMFRAHETGNDALLNHGNKPTPIGDVMGSPAVDDEETPDFEVPDTGDEEGTPDENGLVWHSFDEVPGISDEQEERDRGFDPQEKLRDFRHSRNGERRRFPSRRPIDFGADDEEF